MKQTKIVILGGCGSETFTESLYDAATVPHSPFYGKFDITYIKIEYNLGKKPVNVVDKVNNWESWNLDPRTKEAVDIAENLSGNIIMMGCGADYKNLCKDCVGVSGDDFLMRWKAADWIDKVSNKFDKILALEAGTPMLSEKDSDELYWDIGMNPKKLSVIKLVEKSYGIMCNTPYLLDLNSINPDIKVWDFPLLKYQRLQSDKLNHPMHFPFKPEKNNLAKIFTLQKCNDLPSAYGYISEDLLNTMNRIIDSPNNTFVDAHYHARVMSRFPIGFFPNPEISQKIFKSICDYGFLDKVVIDSFWDTKHEVRTHYIAHVASFAILMHFHRVSELMVRSTMDFVASGVPCISPAYYYPKLLYPDLCVDGTNWEQFLNIIDRPYSEFATHVEKAQSLLKKYNLYSNPDRVAEFYSYFCDFFEVQE